MMSRPCPSIITDFTQQVEIFKQNAAANHRFPNLFTFLHGRRIEMIVADLENLF